MTTNENIIVALIGIFNFSIIMLLVWQIVKKYSKTEQDKTAKPRTIKNLLQLLLPQFIVLSGAIITRISGHVLLPLILSMIISMALIAANTYYLEDYKFIQEAGSGGRVGYVLTRIIPSVFFYFFFLFAVCGFNFDKMKALFNAR
jgi:hypothetical protein